MFDALPGNAWVKRLLLIAGICGAIVTIGAFPGKIADIWGEIFGQDHLSIAHLDEMSSTARLGDGQSGLSRADNMYWPLAFSILNPTSDVVSIEEILVNLPTAMVDSKGTRLSIKSAKPYRHHISAADTIPALKALMRGDQDAEDIEKQALPIALSPGKKLYIHNEMSFQLPAGYGFVECATKVECNTLLIRALGSEAAGEGRWRCPHGPFELTVKTRDHGDTRLVGSSIILIEGCILFRP